MNSVLNYTQVANKFPHLIPCVLHISRPMDMCVKDSFPHKARGYTVRFPKKLTSTK